MSRTTVHAGNIARSPCVFVPASGECALVDVSCRIISPAGTITDITASIVRTAANTFYVDYTTPDIGPAGLWTFRWESASPSPIVRYETEDTQFVLLISAFGASA